MRSLMILGLALAPFAASATNEKPVTPTSPKTTFATKKSMDEYSVCLLKALNQDYPKSSIEAIKRGKQISVNDGTRTSAVAVVSDLDDKSGALVVMHVESDVQIERDPAVKLAKNCR